MMVAAAAACRAALGLPPEATDGEWRQIASGRRHLAKGGAKNIDITHPAHIKQNICARRNYRYR
eukprot:SAG11_NODE_10_length_27955_cov_15.365235_8_plen_64_part_00